MELFSDLFVLPLLILLTSLLFFYLFNNHHNSGGTTTTLPPGKKGFPIIGETLSFLFEGNKGQPEKFIFDRVKKYSSYTFKMHLFGAKGAVFAGLSGNRFLFTNENKLVKTWWPKSIDKVFPSSSQSSPSDEMIKLRKMLPNFLKAEALRNYIGIMDRISQKHFENEWENKKQLLIFPLTKEYTLSIACKVFISVDDARQVDKFSELFKSLSAGLISIPIDFPGTPFNKAVKASKHMREELASIIKQRKIDLSNGKASPTQDILSHMLLASDGDGRFMHELEIADKILGLLVGGHDTTSSALAFIVKYLAELPEIYDEVYKEQMEIAKSKSPGECLNWDDVQRMKYSWNVACEVLRLSPPVQGAFREAISDFTYDGFSIPKGWKLYWSANSTHKNPEFFLEPYKFDPSRFNGSGPAPYTFVPFGGGPRMCPGKEYARLKILVFMHHLVKRFKWDKIIPDEKIVVNPMPAPANDLPIRLYPHNYNSV